MVCLSISLYSSIYGVDPKIIDKIVQVESSFNPNAISTDNSSIGLMQVQIPTARDMGFRGTKKELLDPDTNIKVGVKYFKYLSKRYNNPKLALLAYNKGLGNADKVKHIKRVESIYASKVFSKSPTCN